MIGSLWMEWFTYLTPSATRKALRPLALLDVKTWDSLSLKVAADISSFNSCSMWYRPDRGLWRREWDAVWCDVFELCSSLFSIISHLFSCHQYWLAGFVTLNKFNLLLVHILCNIRIIFCSYLDALDPQVVDYLIVHANRSGRGAYAIRIIMSELCFGPLQ